MSILQSKTYLNDLKYVIKENDVFDLLKDKSIFITGGTGLICSGIVDLLLMSNLIKKSRIHVYLGVRDEERAKKRFFDFADSGMKEYLSFIKYDATCNNSIDVDVDYIIHGASNAHPKAFVEYPVDTMISNFYGIKELLDFSRKKNIKNVLYISSSEVYGQTVKKNPFKENEYGYLDITNPRNAYASSKRASETLCVSYYKQYGVKSNIVRPGHIYGPTASMTDSRVSSFFAYAAAEGKDLEIKSEGKQIRSYCYVLDCASAIITVLLKGKPSEVYNISNENSIMSIKDIASLYAEEGAVNVIFNLPSKQEKSAFNPMENSSLDNTKLRMIGWKGLFDSKLGTSHTIKILRGE